MAEFDKKRHTLSLDNRESLSLGGVKDVESFNEEEIVAHTDYGKLLIKGSSLNVEILDLQSGELSVSGTVDALVYSNNVIKKGMLGGLFRS